MSDSLWIFLGLAVGGFLFLVGWQVYRRWKTGREADKLLEQVIKGKDAFRR